MLKEGKIAIYPTSFARLAAGYHRGSQALSVSFLAGSRFTWPPAGNGTSLTTLTLQLSYTRHLPAR